MGKGKVELFVKGLLMAVDGPDVKTEVDVANVAGQKDLRLVTVKRYSAGVVKTEEQFKCRNENVAKELEILAGDLLEASQQLQDIVDTYRMWVDK